MNFYDDIYAAAKSRDKTKIKEILEKGGCIDEWKKGTDGWTATAQLVFEGDINSANWLITFGANLNHIVLAAAQRGDEKYVTTLIELGADPNFAAQGAARGNKGDLLGKLRENYTINKRYIAQGFAQSGLEINLNLLGNNLSSVKFAALGAAQGGYIGYVKKLLAGIRESAPKNFDGVMDLAIQGAAQNGNIDAVNQLLAEFDYTLKTNLVGQRLALGGHEKEVKKWLDKYMCDVSEIIRAAVLGGHIGLVKNLLNSYKQVDLEPIFLEVIINGHIKYAEILSLDYGVRLPKGSMKYAKEQKQVSRLLSFIMKTTGLDYPPICDWADSPELRNWMLVRNRELFKNRVFFEGKAVPMTHVMFLPPEMHTKIASFFTHGFEKTTHEMYEKMCFYLYKQLLLDGLTNLQPSVFNFFRWFDVDANGKRKKLEEQVKESRTAKEIIKLLEGEKASIDKQRGKKYVRFFERHLARYQQLKNPQQPAESIEVYKESAQNTI